MTLNLLFVCSAGRDVWMATTRAFADQLASQGAHYRAVLYYLACHDTYKAIEMFRKQAMYRYQRRAVCYHGNKAPRGKEEGKTELSSIASFLFTLFPFPIFCILVTFSVLMQTEAIGGKLFSGTNPQASSFKPYRAKIKVLCMLCYVMLRYRMFCNLTKDIFDIT